MKKLLYSMIAMALLAFFCLETTVAENHDNGLQNIRYKTTKLSVDADNTTGPDWGPGGDNLKNSRTDYVQAGNELFTVTCAQILFGGEGLYPELPPDFFGPGSEPFTGTIKFEGANSNGTTLPLPDLNLERLGDIFFSEPLPDDQTVPIEILQLDLESVEPIVVNVEGVDSFFDVFCELEVPDPDNSSQTVSKLDEIGGTFVSLMGFHPRFVFTEVDNPSNQIMWSPYDMGYEPAIFTQPEPYPWTHSPISNSFDPMGDGLIEMVSGDNNYIFLSPLLQRIDDFMVEMTEEGFPAAFGGTGYNEGMWFEYPNYGWWNVWFYDHPVDNSRSKKITANFFVEPRNPDFPTEIEIVFNWSTPEWPGYPEVNRPPLPEDVPDPQTEDMFIGRSETIFAWQGNLFEPIPLDNILYEIPDFNPEWLSIDIRGFNFMLSGSLVHTCFREETCPDPIQPPTGLFLRPGHKTNPESWYAWMGDPDGTTPVQLFADDPDEQISSVDFYYTLNPDMSGWTLFDSDDDGFSYPAPGPVQGIYDEADGWLGHLPHNLLPQDLTPVYFMAQAVTLDGEVFEVVADQPLTYDPSPPSSFESTLEEGFITDEDHVTVTITPDLANLDYVVFNVSEKPEWYQKDVPFITQQDSMSCGPYALAACLKYFANNGYPDIDGGLSVGDLAEELKDYVNYDEEDGTLDRDMANGVRKWIEANGGGFTVTGPEPFSDFDATDMRDKLEGDALVNGMAQNIIPLFQWTYTDDQGNTQTAGHFMTMSSVHNSPVDGKRKFDFMDPGSGITVEGFIDEETGECSGFDDNYPPDGSHIFSTIMICPDEPAPDPTGTGTTVEGPEFPPTDLPLPDSGKTIVRTRAVDNDGHKSERTTVITRVPRASCPDTSVKVGGPPFVPQGANPPGGTFDGPGFIDSLFHPVDTGYFPVVYSYTYPNGFTSEGDFTIRVFGLDFGDAPDEPYPTLYANDGARHIIDGTTFMGDLIDYEDDGQPTAAADGDDIANLADEDGVTFLTTMVPGKPAQVKVNASVDGGLSAWIDFNQNGSWADPGEQIFTDEMLAAGDNTLTFLVPSQANLGNTYARFRFSSQQLGLSYTGLAENGEVEDYQVEIIENQTIKWIQYPDTEFHGYHSHQQEGPDIFISDDWQCEGGKVTDLHWWGYYEVPNTGPCAGFRITIYDNDGSGPYNKPGGIILTWDAPFGTNPGEVGEYYTGRKAITNDDLYYYYFVLPEPFAQTEGNFYWLEVMALSADDQNHVVWEWQTNGDPIVLSKPLQRDESGYEAQLDRNMAFVITSEPDEEDNYDFGDAPDQPYPTLLASNGARHFLDGQTYLGSSIDDEPDGLPNANATGDDLNNLYDEDGVTFIDPFVVGDTAELKIQASTDGYLNAWIDLNKNGSWGEAAEHIFIDQALSSGINTLTFNIPSGVTPGATYIRFRFNTTGGLDYYGPADNGEVEDYRIIIYPPDWGYTPTGSSHIISIPASISFNCISLSAGDFMGTFYTDENGNPACGGAAFWDGINNQTLVAFGDDITTTSIKEGFDENEDFTWRVYYSATGTQEEVIVNYNPALPDSDGKFHDNGISALTSVVKKLSVNANATPNPLCAGDTVLLSAVVSGGCGGNTFAWTSDPAGFTSSAQNTADTPIETTTYYVIVTNSFGDSDTAWVNVSVNDPPLVTCPDDFTVCLDDGPVTLTGGIPVGGNYVGTGVISGIFYPSIAGSGTHIITYEYTNPNTGCSASCQFLVTVNTAPQLDCPPFMEACEDDPPVLLNSASPAGGIYSGTGVSFDGTDYWFDPAIGPGTYLVTYCFTDPDTNCEACCEFNFYVYEKPDVNCPEDFTVCIDTSPFVLTGGIPTGGEYSGTGVTYDGTDYWFDPATAGAGDHEITYSYVDPQTNCENFCTFIITVIEVQVTCPDDFEICADDGPITLTGGLPAGGTYSGTGVSGGVFNPPSPFGGSYLITYTYVDPESNCSGSCDFSITVNPSPQVDCPPFMEACEDDSPVLLNTASPAGGIYSGAGVSFDGTNYWFDPAIGPGTYIINYCYTDPDTNCESCCEFNFYVYEKPDVTCPEDFTVCIDTSPFVLTGGIPTGGDYSGTGVTYDGTDYWFDPAMAGSGDHIITYIYIDPQTFCGDTCTFTITVIEVEVTCPDDMAVCVNGLSFVLSGGTPAGGTYSGPGVSGGIFHPATAGVGVHTITYTYVEPGTNCSGSCDYKIEVYPQPQTDCPPFMEACEDDPLVLLNTAFPAGGIYSGTGVSFDGTDYWFDPAVGTGTYIINYCFTDPDTGCEGCCEFNFYVYEKPVVECPEDMIVCLDTPAFVLTGATPAGGAYSGTAVTFDGTDYWFDPAMAGPGTWEITYTYVDPQTFCENFCTFKIVVIEAPQVECPDDMEVCINEDPFELTGGTPEGGTYSGPGVSGGFFDPSVAGTGSHIITYTVGVPGTNCFAECEFVITVNPLPQMDCPPFMEACEDDPPILLASAYPLGGEYTGTGVYFDGLDYYFDPGIGAGTYLITYCVEDPATGCENCCEFNFYVYPKPVVGCPDDFAVCLETAPFALTGATPVGGTYSGPGVSGGIFNPATAGAGVHTIMYSYTDPQTGCSNFCNFTITVIEIEVTCPDDFEMCANEGPVTLSGGLPAGGSYAGPGVSGGLFTPPSPLGGSYVITYTYVEPDTNCSGSCEFVITVNPQPQTDCPPFMEACEDDPLVLLNTAFPAGGIYSGTGVNFDGTDYWFDPSIGPGTYIITYCFTDPDTGCENCCEFNFYVYEKPVVECPEDMVVCLDTPAFVLTGATPAGGAYSGTAVTFDGTDYWFDPAGAGPGTWEITYTYVDPQTFCENFCTFKITVIEAPQVDCPDDMEVCINDDPFELTGGTPEGGTYSGPGVSGGIFNPSTAGVGSHIITYTVGVPGTNCFAECEFVIVVNPLPQMDCPPFMEACEDDPPVMLNNSYPLGGDYTGTGVFFDGTDYWFDPSVGQGTYIITYCFTDPDTGCENCCEYNFIVHPKPEVTCSQDYNVCIDTPPFTVSGGSPLGGEYTGTGITFDGTDYWFDPAAAGAGDHIITYTYTDPQTLCENFCTFTITVIEVEVTCPDDMAVCVNGFSFVLSGATPAGGIYSGPGVTGGVFDPSNAGVGLHSIIYTYVEPGTNCSDSCNFTIEVKPLPEMDCPPEMQACEDDLPVLLNTADPEGGEYSGTGVSFDGTDYWFDPTGGPGTYIITYCYTDTTSGCENCCEFNFYVIEYPEVTCPEDFTVCVDDDPFELIGGIPVGGNYSGTGVVGSDFNPADAGIGTHTITYTYIVPGTNCSDTCTFKITVTQCQVVPVIQGWGSLSSYLEPVSASKGVPVQDVLQPIWDELIVAKYFSQLIYPEFGINTMDDYSTDHGYILKTTEPVDLTIYGEPADPTVPLSEGWNVMPVVQECSIDAATVFGSIPELIYAFEVSGNGIYYPDGGIYTLDTLSPGMSYYVKVSSATEYTYPGCASKTAITYVPVNRTENTTTWNEVNYTGLAHTVVFSEEAMAQFNSGDLVGAFTADGICAGIVEVADDNTGLVLFGDDHTTVVKDGFEENEFLSFRLYRPEGNEEFDLEASYASNHNPGYFEQFGLSIITRVKMSATGINDPGNLNVNIYPNPSGGIFNIEGCPEQAMMSIYNTYGEEIVSNQSVHDGTINLSNQPNGVYIVRIKTDSGSTMLKLVKE